jgi:7,8-dihydropterin-6-yl-methyl-4-(beta-D-ribofuranosyl)aminobenzene 5'-phosphate synthase
MPGGNRSIFVEANGCLELDSFSHELVLVIQEPDGLGVFTGCAHQGVLNMIQAVTKAFPGCPIKAAFGGFHLMAMPPFNFMSGSKDEVFRLENGYWNSRSIACTPATAPARMHFLSSNGR